MNSTDDRLSKPIQAAVEISVVIPVYNSADTLTTLVGQLIDALNRINKLYELILVDDGSRDQSWTILEGLQLRHPDRIIAIQLMRNYGQDNAIMCGFRHAGGRFIVTMDDDLQHPPKEVPRLLEAIQTGRLDLVYGVYKSKKHSRWRNSGSRLINSFYKIVFKTPITMTSFRVMRRELMVSIFSYSLNFTFIDGLLAWNTQRIGEVAVEHHERTVGRSNYSLRKMILLALNLLTNFSLIPLQIMSAVGVMVAGGGFVAAMFYLYQYLSSGIPVPGYASIIVSVLVLGGLQLLALGIMGEYLGRLHLNVNRKPQYTERTVLKGRSIQAEEKTCSGWPRASSQSADGGEPKLDGPRGNRELAGDQQ